MRSSIPRPPRSCRVRVPPAHGHPGALRGQPPGRGDGRSRQRHRPGRHPHPRQGRPPAGRRPPAPTSWRAIDRDLPGRRRPGRPPRRWRPTARTEEDLSKIQEVVEDAPIVKFVNLLITQGIQDGASDIHLEPTETTCGCGSASTACCTRSCARRKSHPVRRHQPPEDHGRHQHRRAAHPAGRPAVGQRATARRSTCAWRPCPRCGARRSSCESWTTRTGRCWTCRTWGSRRATSSATSRVLHQAVRDDPGHRPDRLGQVDDAVRDAEHDQPARGQHHHRRGPGRVPARRASTRSRPTPRPA